MRAYFALLLLPSIAAFAQEATNKTVDVPRMVNAYAAAAQAGRKLALQSAYKNLDSIRRDRKLSKDDRANKVATIELYISELEDPAKPYFPPATFDVSKAKVGDMGAFRNETLAVLQVVDRKNSILDVSWSEPVTTGVRNVGTTQVPVRGVRHRESEIWLANYPTTGMVDGRGVKLNGVFAVTGTKTYDTDNGSHTVPLLEQIDLGPYESKFTRMNDTRTWTSAGGDHKTEAIFVRYKGGKVSMMKPDGKVIDVPLEKLSDDDRQFVRDWLKSTKSK